MDYNYKIWTGVGTAGTFFFGLCGGGMFWRLTCEDLRGLRRNLGLQETLKHILADDATTADLVIRFMRESGLLQDRWKKPGKLYSYRKLLSRTNILTTILVSEDLRATLPCRKNAPLYVIWCGGSFKRLQLVQLFPPDARWLLFMDNATASIGDVLGDMNIPFDCEFLVATASQGAVELTEVYRVLDTLPLVTSHWGRWSLKDGLTAPGLSLIRRRNDFRGVDFIAAGIHDTPLEYLGKEDSDGYVEVRGYSFGLWSELSKRLNFSLKIRRSPDEAYGLQLPNGSWNGIMGMVLDGTANASLSILSITTARSNFVDFTVPVFLMWFDVFIRTRYDSDDSWGIYQAPFTLPLWLSVAGCVLVITCTLGIMYCLQPEDDTNSLQDTFFSVLGTFCSQGVASLPLHVSPRLVVWVTLLTAVVVLGSYGARVTSSLAVKKPILPFKDHKGILEDSTYGFGMNGKTGLVQMYKESAGVRREVYKRKILPNLRKLPMNHEEGFQKTCKEKYAFLCGRPHAEPEFIPCDLTVIPEVSNAVHTAFILRKGSPYRRIINYTLRRMMTAGIYRKLHLQWLLFPDNREPPPVKSVALSDVEAVLLLGAFGGVISLVVFILELLVRRKHYRRQQSLMTWPGRSRYKIQPDQRNTNDRSHVK